MHQGGRRDHRPPGQGSARDRTAGPCQEGTHIATARVSASDGSPGGSPTRTPRRAALRRRLRSRLLTLALTIGPGILALAGDNDAGGLLTYVSTGGRFGGAFFVPLLVPLGLLAFAVQEMAMRLGVVAGKNFSVLLRERVDPGWARLVAIDLAIQNWCLLTTEFVGMGLGMAHFGIPLRYGVPLAAVLVGTLLFHPYRTVERAALVLAGLSVLFVPLAVWRHPALGAVGLWPAQPQPDFGFFVVAAVGNALAPWMIFFQAQAVHDKGIGEHQLRAARIDLALGSVLQVSVAAAVILLAAATSSQGASFDAAAWIARLGRSASPAAGDLFAVGLFDAGLVAALTVSLSSASAVVETCTGRLGAEGEPARSPLFRVVYLVGLASAAAVTLLPGLPLDLVAVAAQVASAVLMPPVLAMLVLLAGDVGVMPRHRNGRLLNWTGVAATALFTATVAVLLWHGLPS